MSQVLDLLLDAAQPYSPDSHSTLIHTSTPDLRGLIHSFASASGSPQSDTLKTCIRSDSTSGQVSGYALHTAENSINLEHWYRCPDGTQHSQNVIRISSSASDRPYDISILGGRSFTMSAEDFQTAWLPALKAIHAQISMGQYPNIIRILKDAGIALPEDQPPITGQLASGQPHANVQEEMAPHRHYMRVPKTFLGALIGDAEVEFTQAHAVALGTQDIKSDDGKAVVRRIVKEDHKGGYLIEFQVAFDGRSEDEKVFKTVLGCHIRPDHWSGNSQQYYIKTTKWRGQRCAPWDGYAVNRTLNVIREASHDMHRGRVPDLLNLFRKHGLENVFPDKSPPPLSPKDGGETEFRILGGNDLKEPGEGGLGANSYQVTHKYTSPAGKVKSHKIVVDAGEDFRGFGPHVDHPDAMLLTHLHLDHIGFISHLVKQKQMNCPVYCDKDAETALKTKLREEGIPKTDWPEIKTIQPYDLQKIGPYLVMALPMSHSSKCQGYFVMSPAGSIFFMGDGKVDPTSQAGLPTDLKFMKKIFGISQNLHFETFKQGFIEHFHDREDLKRYIVPKPEELWEKWEAALRSFTHISPHHHPEAFMRRLREIFTVDIDTKDCTRIENKQQAPLEEHIFESLSSIFAEAKQSGQGIIATFIASNANRMVTNIRAAAANGQDVIISGKAMKDMVRYLNASGTRLSSYEKLKDYFKREYGIRVVQDGSKESLDVMSQPNGQWIALVTGSQGNETMSGTDKLMRAMHPTLQRRVKDFLFLLEQVAIPGNDHDQASMVHRMQHGLGLHVVTATQANQTRWIYTSGHGGQQDATKLHLTLRPRYTAFIHGTTKQLRSGLEWLKSLGTKSKALLLPNNSAVVLRRDKTLPLRHVHYPDDYVSFRRLRPEDKFWGGAVAYLRQRNPSLRLDEHTSGLYHIHRSQLRRVKHCDHVPPQMFHDLCRISRKAIRAGEEERSLQTNFNKRKQDFRYLKRKGNVGLLLFDFETTGLHRLFSFITQFSASLYEYSRKLIEHVNYRQRVPLSHIASLQALLVTGIHPETLNQGDSPRQFAHKVMRFFRKPEEIYGEKKVEIEYRPGHTIKGKANALLAGHNIKNADIPWANSLFHNACFGNPFIASSDGRRGLDTLWLARAVTAAGALQPEVDATGNEIYKLSSLARALKIKVDDTRLHDAAYDIELNEQVLWGLFKAAPDVCERMMLNLYQGDVQNYLSGVGRGFDNNQPIIAFGARENGKWVLKMGCLIGFDHQSGYGNKAFIYDLSSSPEDIAKGDYQQLEQAFQDKRIVTLNLKKQPIILTGEMGIKAGAAKGVDYTTLCRWKAEIETHQVWMSRHIEELSLRYKHHSDVQPHDPSETQIYNFGTSAPEQNIRRSVSKLFAENFEPRAAEFDLSPEEKLIYYRNMAVQAKKDLDDPNDRMRVWRSVYDECPEALPESVLTIVEEDIRQRLHCQHATVPWLTLEAAQRSYEDILRNPELYAQWVGKDPKKKEILDAYPAYLQKIAKRYPQPETLDPRYSLIAHTHMDHLRPAA